MKKLQLIGDPKNYISTLQAKALLSKGKSNEGLEGLQKYKSSGSRKTFYLKEDVVKRAGISTQSDETDKEIDNAPETEYSPFTIEAYVDGSFDKKTGIYGSAAILVHDGQIIAKKSSKGTKMNSMWNVAGEIAAAAMAVSLAEEFLPDHLVICYDCEAIEKWPTGQWRIKNEYARKYVDFMNRKRNFDICYRHVKAHTGDEFNEMADDMALKAAGITPMSTQRKEFTGEYKTIPVDVLRMKYRVNPNCTLGIAEFYEKEKHAFKDYAALRIGSGDNFSSMWEMERFKGILTEDSLAYIKECLSNESDRINACRWAARGLNPYDAVQKITVDREIYSKN